MLRPGESVHYVSLLDADGEILATVPIDHPASVPKDMGIVSAKIDVKINVQLEIGSKGSITC